MVEIRHLYAGYGDGDVLRDLNLHIPKGQITAILGPNGCGKSTLLKALIGLTPQVRGEIVVEGREISHLSTRETAQKIAYLPQNSRTPDMTAGQLVLHGRFPHLSYPRRYREGDRQAALVAMDKLGIRDLADKPLAQLSGGTQQKCRIAMALAQDAPLILMDEPLSFLDISHQLNLLELSRTLAAQGKTPVLVLHDLALALRYAQWVVVMEEGRIVQTGTPDEILTSGTLEPVFGVKIHQFHTPHGTQIYFAEE